MNLQVETLGRFQLLAHLTTGGMSEIHLALHTGIYGFEKLVVIKRILPHLARDNSVLEMFFDEARIAVELNHPNIVQIYELGEDAGEYYIAMEFLEGESLGYLVNEVISSGRYLPPDLVANIVYHVAEGLEYAHSYRDAHGRSLNIIHRDVSPQNIFLTFTGSIKLLDFGIATARSQIHKTQAGTMKGKIAYMSPEQIAGMSVDGRSDIYSLGVVLWELLARFRLYNKGGDKTIAKQIAFEPVQSIRSFRPEVPDELEQVAMKALQKKPSNRYRHAGEMRDDLWSYLVKSRSVLSITEIARYLEQVLAQRIRKKRELLQSLRHHDFQEDATVLSMFQPEPEDEEFEFESDVVLIQEPVAREPEIDAVTVMVDRKIRKARTPKPNKSKSISGIQIDRHEQLPQLSRSKAPWFLILVAVVVGGLTVHLLFSKTGSDQSAKNRNANQSLSSRSAKKGADSPLTLRLLSKPSNCRIFLNGQVLGERTPIQQLAVEANKKHSVIIDCPKHYREIKTVKGRPGQEIILEFRPTRIRNPRF